MRFDDYEEWRNRNLREGPFSMPSYIQGVFDYKDIHEDLCFAFLNLFWPELVEIDGMVFIKDFYSANKDNLSKGLYKSKSEAEFWINLLSLDDFLHIKDEEKLTFLVNKIAESWKAKLKQDFPRLRFKVVVADDEDDIGITFQQV